MGMSALKAKIRAEVGKTYRVPYPFSLVTISGGWDEPPTDGWKPGCNLDEGDYEAGIPRRWLYDDWGWMVVTVLSSHTVPGFKERLFYTLRWIDPEGNEYGLNTLRVKSASAVSSMISGHRYVDHPDGLTTVVEDAA